MEVTRAFRRDVLSKSAARVITVLTALMLVGGAMAASGPVKDARAADRADGVELTYTVWFSPAMIGVVGGDIVGTLGGDVATNPIPNSPLVRLTATYVITATNDPSRSFTAIVKGYLNTNTNRAVLNGVVTAGWLTGERVHSVFHVVSSCLLNTSGGPCFPGTLRVTGDSEAGDSGDQHGQR